MSAKKEIKTCFVIAPIGKEGSTTRKRSDKLLKHIVKPVLEDLGYIVERADQLTEPGMITNQIVRKIVDCNVLVADLSESNPNVFYELAIRHGLKKPFVHMIDSSETIPFDNAQVRTIQVDLTDLDSVERAKSDLNSQVQAIEAGTLTAESPISIAFDLEALKSSGKSDDSVLAAMFHEISAMRGEMREISRNSLRRSASSHALKTKEDLLALLTASGHSALAQRLVESATIHKIEPLKIELTTTFSPEDDQLLEQELTAVLRRRTGQPWIVEVYPF